MPGAPGGCDAVVAPQPLGQFDQTRALERFALDDFQQRCNQVQVAACPPDAGRGRPETLTPGEAPQDLQHGQAKEGRWPPTPGQPARDRQDIGGGDGNQQRAHQELPAAGAGEFRLPVALRPGALRPGHEGLGIEVGARDATRDGETLAEVQAGRQLADGLLPPPHDIRRRGPEQPRRQKFLSAAGAGPAQQPEQRVGAEQVEVRGVHVPGVALGKARAGPSAGAPVAVEAVEHESVEGSCPLQPFGPLQHTLVENDEDEKEQCRNCRPEQGEEPRLDRQPDQHGCRQNGGQPRPRHRLLDAPRSPQFSVALRRARLADRTRIAHCAAGVRSAPDRRST